MKFYHQTETDGTISATVKSAVAPLNVDQIVLDAPLAPGTKKFDPVTKEVTWFKHIREESEVDGETISTIIDTVEDTKIPRKKIDDANILKRS